MNIETPRMIIRDFIPEDAADLHEILGDDETMQNCEPAYDFEKTKKFLASFCIGRKGAVAAVHKESGKMIGYILFNEFDDGVYEMGWICNRSFWHQGYTYESCKAVIDYAFEKLKVHKIFAETIDNVKSVSLMRKLGMQLEGVQRSQTKDNHGDWADLHFYGLLEDDWKKDKINAIRTERLTIRRIVADDWKSIKEIWVDFNASALSQYDHPHITDDEDVQPRIAKWAAANRGTEHIFFAICFEDTVIGYSAFNIRESGYEVGYCFHSAYHGKGYAKESHLALFDYMRELGIKRLTAGTAINNTPSVALLKSLGFELIETEKVSFYKDADGNDIVFEGGVFELML